MESENIILSICIPTYNRGEILGQTLEKYINDPAFNKQVEIVISDNCSCDNTEIIVSKYVEKYSNIKYSRLPYNIGPEYNMSRVLSMGGGLYLKLMNDTVSFNPGCLKYLMDTIGSYKEESVLLLFYQNIDFLTSNDVVYCSNLNDLISNVSFWITWIGNFGIWKKDFDSLQNKDRLAHLQFPHFDWIVTLMNKKQISTIYFGNYYKTLELSKKGGYNVFEVFIDNYLFLYQHYLNNKSLKLYVFKKEKKRLLKFFLSPWISRLFFKESSSFYFETTGWHLIFWRHYKFYPLFYYILFKHFIRRFLKRMLSERLFKI